MKVRILRTPGKALGLPYQEGQIVECTEADGQALINRRPPLAEVVKSAAEKPKKTESAPADPPAETPEPPAPADSAGAGKPAGNKNKKQS